ncbi:DUF1501 domain-containing protein [Bremerella cremea]|uniref:DUF1501 domain-containing protein n=1 Tax=Bremerella cremea TaxID=1031537 RepID=A0A368KTN0_9BACT|nr:DUF1501 domain-containing protein [Bremerella cremea]RCS49460.1 DUF1501 domain-containing protein [Bremerella cremea]
MNRSTCSTIEKLYTRRDVLQRSACGFGWLAFAGMAGRTALSAQSTQTQGPLAPKVPTLPQRAKRVIFLCMSGAPSHVDLLDYKPRLNRDTGKPGPRAGSQLLGSKWRFSQHGQSGHWMSELLPKLAQQADKLCIVPSMQTDLPAHPQAFIKLHTGTAQFVRPSMGAWTLYGLGTENQNLPGFVSLTPPSGFGGATNYGSSFLPAIYQGTRIGQNDRPIRHASVANLQGRSSRSDQRAELDFIQTLNRDKQNRDSVNPDVEGVIQSYELAFRMQQEMPQVLDISRETSVTQHAYGIDKDPTDDMGRKCLLARRLVEAGVRFVEITHGNWDHHFDLNNKLQKSCREVDQPIAALLADLEQRDLLRDTLVVWTGEFGRTPYAEGQDGRDHNTKAFTMWMAGGGIKPGITYGRSDDYGYEAVENPVQIADLHATILATLGLDHKALTYRHAGRDFRLTDVKGNVIEEIMI